MICCLACSQHRRYHSTETAVLKVLSDILYVIDTSDLSVLALLDLSAAFDTVDHGILLQRLETSFGVGGLVLEWFRSYLTNGVQHVREAHPARHRGRCGLDYHRGQCWVHSCGSVDLIGLVENHGFIPHMYADDSQINGSCHSGSAGQLQHDVCQPAPAEHINDRGYLVHNATPSTAAANN